MADLHVHTLTVRNHRISCNSPVLVQHGMGHDAIALDLDAEWDGLSARLVLGPCGSAYDVLYEDAPVVVPAATLAEAGWLPVSVVGYGGDGTVRVTTERCDHLLRVVESGCVDGSVPPEDQPDLLEQLVAAGNAASEAAKSANEAASKTEKAVSDAVTAADNANNAATSAKEAEDGLKKAAEDGEFDGEKGDPGFSPKANVAQESDGATISITDESGTTTAKVSNGADGSPGKDGESAEISGMTVSVDEGTGTPSVDVEMGGTPTSRTFALSFHNLKGNDGPKGDAPAVGIGTVETLEPGSQATASVTETQTGVDINLGIPKGDKGDPGEVSAVQAAEGSDLSVSTDEGAVTIDDSALRARIAELENQAANVVTGTSTDLVSHAEDAYAQKPIETRIKGKTWVNRWPVLSGTHDGITVATDGTGLVTVTGTATVDADVTADVSGWATGKSYTTMISATPTGCSAYFEVQKPSGNTSINATTTGATLNVASDATNCVAGVHVTSGTTVNASFRVMLVDGTEAPDCFTPCASIASVETGKLVTAGKNLVPSNFTDVQYTANTAKSVDADPIYFLPGETVTASFYKDGVKVSGTSNCAIYLLNSEDSFERALTLTASRPTGVIGQAVENMVARVTCNNLFSETDCKVSVQLELGSTATPYEPPSITQTPPPRGGAAQPAERHLRRAGDQGGRDVRGGEEYCTGHARRNADNSSRRDERVPILFL